MNFGKTRMELEVAIDSNAGGAFPWVAVADVPWIALDPAEGAGAATMSVKVDRGGLALGESTGTVTVRSGNVEKTIQVAAAYDTGLCSAYWPLAVGNTWRYGLPAFEDLYPDEDVVKAGTDLFSFAVTERFVVGQDLDAGVDGIEVWKVDASVPLLSVAEDFSDHLPWDFDYSFQMLFAEKRVAPRHLPNTSVDIYLASVDDTWYVTAHEQTLENLPATNGFYRLDDILKAPADAMQLLYGGSATVLFRELVNVYYETSDDLAMYFEAYGPATKQTNVWPEEWQQIEAMLLAFSTDFAEYDNPSAVYSYEVRALAVLAGGADTFENLVSNLDALAEGLPERFETISLELPEYWEAVLQDPSLEVPLLEAFSAQFAGYLSDDVLVNDYVNILVQLSDCAALVATNAAFYTESDYEALAELSNNVTYYVSLYGAMGLMNPEGFGQGFKDYLASYPSNGSQAIEDVLVSSDALIDAITQFLMDVTDEDRQKGNLLDIIEVHQDLHAFFVEFASTHDDTVAAFMAEATEVTLESLSYMEDMVSLLDEFRDTVKLARDANINFSPEDRDLASLVLLTEDLAEWFSSYTAGAEKQEVDQGELYAGATAIVLTGAHDMVVEIAAVQTELDGMALVSRDGMLSDFTPIDHGLFQIHLMDFGLTGIDDCTAEGIELSPDANGWGEELPEWIPSTIYGRNVGPVLFGGFFPLQSVTIAGAQE
jgi:hypothetical protein